MARIAEKMKLMSAALRGHDKVANAVTNEFMAKLPGAKGNGSQTPGHAWKNGNGIDINVERSLFKNLAELKWTVTHESGHNFGLEDILTKSSANSPLPSLPTAEALRNADHVVEFAFKP
jgi:hypothetical protein